LTYSSLIIYVIHLPLLNFNVIHFITIIALQTAHSPRNSWVKVDAMSRRWTPL